MPNQFVAKEYYASITEAAFDGFKDAGADGVCVYVNLPESLIYFTHSTCSNCKYRDGTVFVGSAGLVLMNFVCFESNSGRRGSHFCDSLTYELLSFFANNTHEQSANSNHGSMASGRLNSHFCYNNVSRSIANIYSPLHYIDDAVSSVLKYSQMSHTESACVSSWNEIKSKTNLRSFNFINCSATTLNIDLNNKDVLTYTDCVFALKNKMALGSRCGYVNCVSDGSILADGIKQGDKTIDVTFAKYLQCVRKMNNCHFTLHLSSHISNAVIGALSLINFRF